MANLIKLLSGIHRKGLETKSTEEYPIVFGTAQPEKKIIIIIIDIKYNVI